MIEATLLVAFGAATIRVATPLAFAALGETITERGGVLNLGIEGAMLAGALGAALGASGGHPWVGVGYALAAGVLTSLVLALAAVGFRADQIISGTAVTLAATGLTGLIAERRIGGLGGMSVATLAPVRVPLLADIPVLGPIVFEQSVLTYLVVAIVPLAGWLLFRTRFGLELRAAGESVSGAAAAGVRVGLVRSVATAIGGGLAGLGGASLVLAQVGSFAERMTAGRGFIAIAIVVLGRWQPVGAVLAALLFGAATALQYLFQASGTTVVPYQVLIGLPYLLALAVLATAVGRSRAPAALGRNE